MSNEEPDIYQRALHWTGTPLFYVYLGVLVMVLGIAMFGFSDAWFYLLSLPVGSLCISIGTTLQAVQYEVV